MQWIVELRQLPFSLLPLVLLLVDWLRLCTGSFDTDTVKVYQFTINYWREGVEGLQRCGPQMRCEWTYSDNLKVLRQRHHNASLQLRASRAAAAPVSSAAPDGKKKGRPVTLAVYNIHSWWERMKEHGPALCELPTTLHLAESEESRVRYHALFDPTLKLFDGYSTTHPASHVQRVYDGAFVNATHFLEPMHNFSSLIKAGSYVAGDCHKRDSANANRDHYVYLLRKAGFRVEGLGKCMHTVNPEGVTLPSNPEARYDMVVKRKAIARFMFNMAFENSIEEGYVTEKPFDALISGTVPVYLGDAAHLKRLLPHPKAAIFIADYNGNMEALADYLKYLTRNETAYEEHRAWRKTFSYEENIRNKPLLQKSWECRVCEWAAENVHLRQKRPRRACNTTTHPAAAAAAAVAAPAVPAFGATQPASPSLSRKLLEVPAASPGPVQGAGPGPVLGLAQEQPQPQGQGQGISPAKGPGHAAHKGAGPYPFKRAHGGRNHTGAHGGHAREGRHAARDVHSAAEESHTSHRPKEGKSTRGFPLEPSLFYVVDGVDVDLLFPPYIKWILKVKENREMYLLLNHTAQLIPDLDTLQSLRIHSSAMKPISVRDLKKWFRIGEPLPKGSLATVKDTPYAPPDAFKLWDSEV